MSKEHERVGTFCDKCRQVMCKCVLKEQTAVDWLIEKLDNNLDIKHSWRTRQYIQEDKKMEKKQIKKSHTHGRNVERGLNDGIYTAEQYYTQTYGE